MKVKIKRVAVAERLPRQLILETADGIRVKELIDILSRKYGDGLREELLCGDEIAAGVLIMLNGVSLFQPDVSLNTMLKDGDEVFFSIMVYGG